MSNKRRDKKNRILRTGESQRKDGRYMYKYQDRNGITKYAYSWRLDVTDPMSDGLKPEKSLREMEQDIAKCLMDGYWINPEKLTVNELIDRYLSLKTGATYHTWQNYNFIKNIVKKDPFGNRRIDSVKLSDAKGFLVGLQKSGRGYSTIKSVRGVLRPAFKMAYDDEVIRRNPFDFELSTVVVNDSVTRDAITREQERRFLDFIRNDRHYCRYYEGIFILLNTGLRISEFVGLTKNDILFDEMRINVDHQLQKTKGGKYEIVSPKTKAGNRLVPMSEEVAACFRKIINERPSVKIEPMVGGHAGFLYLDKNNKPMVAMHWEHYMKHIVDKYNSTYKAELPSITPHVCRHTFCSKCAKAGMNPKTLQYIMGHSDISVTLGIYTHVKSDDAQEDFNRVMNFRQDEDAKKLRLS